MCTRSWKRDLSPQVHPIAVRELAEPVQIQRIEQVGGRIVQRTRFDVDARRKASLVVADSGDQMQDPKRGIERGLARSIWFGWFGKTDALDQLGTVIERVHEFGDAPGVAATHETKGLRRPWICKSSHSMIAGSAGARRL